MYLKKYNSWGNASYFTESAWNIYPRVSVPDLQELLQDRFLFFEKLK